jgi:hypothetical protein
MTRIFNDSQLSMENLSVFLADPRLETRLGRVERHVICYSLVRNYCGTTTSQHTLFSVLERRERGGKLEAWSDTRTILDRSRYSHALVINRLGSWQTLEIEQIRRTAVVVVVVDTDIPNCQQYGYELECRTPSRRKATIGRQHSGALDE